MTWYLDGVSLSTLAHNIKNRSDGWVVPSKEGDNIRVPGRHGAFWVPNKTFSEGHLSLSMWAAGCNADGTLPDNEDGRKKVRDNLDKLTSMFSNSNRLLNLRQVTGTEMPLVNEVTNPTLVSKSHYGFDLATNNVVDSDRVEAVATEVSRNISPNPYLKGREIDEEVFTEDLYPDPGLRQHQLDPAYDHMRSYYYPINQDVATVNQFFRGYNGFSLTTGINGGRGAFRQSAARNWASDAFIGDLGRDVYANRADGVMFFTNLKLSSNSPAASVNLRIRPMISYDGITWTNGTSIDYTITKTAYTWIVVPATNLPALDPGGKFFVQYRFWVVGANSWNAGDAFDIQYISIQDAPKAGNPWRSSTSAALMTSGIDTPYIWSFGSGHMAWSGFRRPRAPEWEVVNTGSTATTAPYAFAWSGRDAANDEGWLAFSVFGGTKNTFRRVLPTPQHSFGDVKIWGRCWSMTTSPVVARVMERTGSSGSYTYTQVGTVTIQNQEAFVSSKFAIDAGKTYCIEIDVPVSDAGLEPAIFFRELHVSNGWVNTNIPANISSIAWGLGSYARFTGSRYASTIRGFTHKPYGITSGIPDVNAQRYNVTTVDWSKVIGEVYAQDGVVELPTRSFSAGYTASRLTVRVRIALANLPHVASLGLLPTTGSATLQIPIYNSGGTLTRTLSHTLSSLTTSYKDYTHTVTLNAGETAAGARVVYSNASFPLATVKLSHLHVMVNLPNDISYFSGSEVVTSSTWTKTSGWVGSAFFSESRLSTALSPHWTVSGFAGFDPDARSIRFTGSSFRVKVADLPAGTAYLGYRRGSHTGDLTVQAQPQGAASPTSLGTITSGTSHAQAMVTIPANATYVDFIVSGGGAYKTVSDVFVMGSWQPVFPIPSSGWVGFTPASNPTLVLPTHPSSQFPLTRVRRNANKTLSFTTGDVPGWTGPVLSGGYLQVPASGQVHTITSNVVAVQGGYASAAVELVPASDAANRITVRIQGATSEEFATNQWTTLAQQVMTTNVPQEIRLVDAAIGDKRHIRLVVVSSNATSPLSRSGIMGIVDGATLTATPVPLGSNFPGHFVGVRSSDGASTYQGNIRQCFVEVTEAIDMQSMAYGTIAEFNVNMTVPGAFWEDVYDTQTTLIPAGSPYSGSFYVAAFDGATAPMNDLIIEIEPVNPGSFSKFTLTDRASGNYIEYDGPPRTKITINTTLATVTDEAGNSMIRYIPSTGSSAIMSLTPYRRAQGESIANHMDGTPILDWSGNLPLKVTITGRRKYLIG